MSKSQIYNKASDIIRVREFEQQHFMKCLEAGICPTCGESLKVVGLPGEKPVLCICKEGCPLISPGGVNYESLKHDVWKNCIDNTIRELAITAREIKKIPSVNMIYQKAVNLMTNRETDLKEFISCLKAGICPNCGEPLQITTHPPESPRVECKKGCALISPEGVDYRFITFLVWEECIDNDIRRVATEG